MTRFGTACQKRVFLPALHEAVRTLLMKERVDSVQIIATTHSPLVMGSVEELWDDATDRLFDFDLEGQRVEFECIPFARHSIFGTGEVRTIGRQGGKEA